MATFFCSRSLPYGATPFNRVPGSVKHTLLSMRRVIGILFANGEYGTWIDINNLSLLYTTSTGITSVAAVDDPIGRAERKAGTNHAQNATTTQRPLLRQWPNDGRYHVYHDRADDKLTLLSMPAGTYTVGFASFAGVFVYPVVLNTTGTLSLPSVDYTELFIVNRVLTDAETAAATGYLGTKTPLIGSNDVLRLYSATNSVNLAITEIGGSAEATWELGDGQTASGTSCVKTIAAPQSVILRAMDPSKIQVIDWGEKSLFGQIKDLSRLTALTSFYCHNNQLTGSIPSLSSNTALTLFGCYSNQLTGFSGGTVSATLGDFQAQNNLLSASAVNAILAAFVAANKTTGTRILNLGGTGNAAPTGQGITDKATLVSRGWTVTTN